MLLLVLLALGRATLDHDYWRLPADKGARLAANSLAHIHFVFVVYTVDHIAERHLGSANKASKFEGEDDDDGMAVHRGSAVGGRRCVAK